MTLDSGPVWRVVVDNYPQQHPRESGGAVGWWVVVGVVGRGSSRQ
jgi:hypothetical protein